MINTSSGTPSWLGAVNDRTGLALLLEHGPLTRNQICEYAGVSKPTASLIMSRLEDAGLITQLGKITGRIGPSPIIYAAKVEHSLGVGVHIGEHGSTASLVDAMRNQYPVVPLDLMTEDLSEFIPSLESNGAGVIVRNIIEKACKETTIDPHNVHRMCFGIDIDSSPHIAASQLGDVFLSGEKVGVQFESTVNLAAISEHASSSKDTNDLSVILWLGTTIAAAVIGPDGLSRGARDSAGRISDLPLREDNNPTQDNSSTTLGEFLSEKSICSFAREYGINAADYSALATTITKVTDGVRRVFLDELARRISLACEPLIAIIDPERLVLAGRLGYIGGNELSLLVDAHIRRHFRADFSGIVASTLGKTAVLAGARELLVSEVRKDILNSITVF